MSTNFTDAAGREWQIALNADLCNRVRKVHRVHLGGANRAQQVFELLGEWETLADILFLLCQQEAEALGIDRDSFLGGLNGDALDAGHAAIVEAFIEFCPAPARDAVRDAYEKHKRAVDQAFRYLGSREYQAKVDAKVDAAIGGAITGAFGAAATAFATTGAALDDMSKRTGVGVTALSELKFAAEQSGSDLETVEKAIRGMSKFMLGAERGTASMAQTLGDLGLSLDSLAGKSPEQQFQILSEAIARVDDPSRRAALAMKVFGKAGSDLLPLFAEGTAGLAAFKDAAHEAGVVMSTEDATAAAALDDAMGKLKTQLGGVVVQIGAAVAGPLTDFAGTIGEVLATTIEWITNNRAMVVLFAEIGAVLAGVGAATYALGSAFHVGAAAIGGVNTALTFLAAHPVVAAVAAITVTIGFLVNEFYKAHDAVTRFDQALKGLDGKRTRDDADDVQALITRYEQLAAKAKLSTDEQKEAFEVMRSLRAEFGDLKTGFTTDGKIFGADKVRAQLAAARQGKSTGLQSQEIALAEASLATRKLEGADANELQERAAAIAKMRQELERTKRIVSDAAAVAPVAGMPPEIANAQAAQAAAMKQRLAGVDANMRAATAAAAPRIDAGAAMKAMQIATAGKFDERILEASLRTAKAVEKIERKPGGLIAHSY